MRVFCNLFRNFSLLLTYSAIDLFFYQQLLNFSLCWLIIHVFVLFVFQTQTPKSAPRPPPKQRTPATLSTAAATAANSSISDDTLSIVLEAAPQRGRPRKTRNQLIESNKQLRTTLVAYRSRVQHLQLALNCALARCRQLLRGKHSSAKQHKKCACMCSNMQQLSPKMRSFFRDQLINVQRKRPSWSTDSLVVATGIFHYR